MRLHRVDTTAAVYLKEKMQGKIDCLFLVVHLFDKHHRILAATLLPICSQLPFFVLLCVRSTAADALSLFYYVLSIDYYYHHHTIISLATTVIIICIAYFYFIIYFFNYIVCNFLFIVVLLLLLLKTTINYG